MDIRDLTEEVKGFCEEDGFDVLEILTTDYGRTVKFILEKEGQRTTLPIIESFYDTNLDGTEITQFHGITDIRNSPWYKEHRKREVTRC